jgi:hypothetical protein
MKFWILVRPRPQSNRGDAGREEKEAPAAGASADVSSAARALKLQPSRAFTMPVSSNLETSIRLH